MLVGEGLVAILVVPLMLTDDAGEACSRHEVAASVEFDEVQSSKVGPRQLDRVGVLPFQLPVVRVL